MNKLIEMQDLVEDYLSRYEETRDSDMKLYVKILEKYGELLGINFAKVSIIGAYNRELMFGDVKIPTIESVGRCRRKLQEKHPEYRGKKEVEQARYEEELVYREYARS